MKNKKSRRNLTVHTYRKQPVYPNAADATYFTDRALNILTAIVSGMGFTTAMVFLITMA